MWPRYWMSRCGNCHDNAVAESFFATFKKRVTKRKIYSTRDDAKTGIFNFIEMFYNPIKRHSHTGGVSPAKYEEAYYLESTWKFGYVCFVSLWCRSFCIILER